MSVKRGVLISFGQSGGSFALQFAANIVLSRLLLPEEIGVFSVSVALLSILQMLRDFGVGQYLVQEKDLTDAKIRTVFGTSLIIGWLLAAAIFFSRFAVADFYNKPLIADIMALLSISFLIIPFGHPASSLMRRERLYGRLALIGLSSTFVSITTSIIAAIMGKGAISLAYGSIAGMAFATVILLSFRPQHLFLRPSLSEWRQVWRFGVTVSGTEAIIVLGEMSPDLVIGYMLGFAPVALYSRGLGLAKLFDNFFGNTPRMVMGAEFGTMHRSGERLTDLVIKATKITTAIGWPFLIFLAFKVKTIIWIFYGPNWFGAVPITQVLCLAVAVPLVITCATALYEGTGAVRLKLRNELWLQIFHVSLVVLGAMHSLLAVAWMRVFYALLMVSFHMSVLHKYAHIGLFYLLKNLLASLSIAVLFAIVLTGLTALEPAANTPWEAAAIIAGEAAIMGVVYLLLLALHRHILWDQIKDVLRNGKKFI